MARVKPFGFDEAYPLSELDARLPDLLSGQKSLWWNVGRMPVLMCG
jgi:Xaa-Pro aminopeptidase